MKINVIFIIIAVIAMFLLFSIGVYTIEKNYNSSTVKETSLATVTKEQPENSCFDVNNVRIYVQQKTNGYGAITSTHTAYAFTYIDEDGNINEVEDFENLQYGSEKVKIGKKDCYVETSSERILYLTKETYENLTKGDDKDENKKN